MQNPAEMAKLCRGAFRKQRVSLGLVKRPDGQLTNSPEESMKVIPDTLFPNSVRTRAKPEHRPPSSLQAVSIPNGPTIYSDTMLQTAFKKFGKSKAAGTDGIKPILHQHLDWSSRQRLAYIMEASKRLAYIPHKWRVGSPTFWNIALHHPWLWSK